MKTRYCQICKLPIDAERLEVVPETRLCTTHAHDIQKYGGEFKLVAEQERTNKAGSLKRNYGAVSTSMIRNEEAMRKLRDAHGRV
ncbi:MAG: hypothetical protein K8T25_21365 [Planctomycetia bacterium]|nr:hypothetical protein [Planctomycetia bacterium]